MAGVVGTSEEHCCRVSVFFSKRSVSLWTLVGLGVTATGSSARLRRTQTSRAMTTHSQFYMDSVCVFGETRQTHLCSWRPMICRSSSRPWITIRRILVVMESLVDNAFALTKKNAPHVQHALTRRCMFRHNALGTWATEATRPLP